MSEPYTIADGERDKALAAVAKANAEWMETALSMLPYLSPMEGTGEQIRHKLSAVIEQPSHHNAWGAMIRHGVRLGLLKPKGQWTKMEDPQSHARQTPVYTVV